ncbi:hypothetical protein BABINDRAFT_160559 [Babjeviella inositovora NRRL Y-12698]|uniref:DUF155 domain-containing protein n=1 Tax=Babjeviella inositovora NRRL Y-12698 TaxID=984486 RepID=A0A1E3QVQ8_9ASCO|nr:uncharacterized protein BABINDRAFT_160559 [Babjeviella inositovora NRRL Y-12698]ODQ81162.1 hypothetical protein BABINDRAFT_160559 [Babjeviella inositovora NRRL Y-12698]
MLSLLKPFKLSRSLRCSSLSPFRFSTSTCIAKNDPNATKSKSNKSSSNLNLRRTKAKIEPALDTFSRVRATANINYQTFPVTAVSICESYDLHKVISGLTHDDYTTNIVIPQEAIHVRVPVHRLDTQYVPVNYTWGKDFDVMVLANGSVVAWGLSEEYLLEHFVPMIKDCERENFGLVESEELDYVEIPLEAATESQSSDANLGSYIDNRELIVIRGSTADQKLLDKATFAFGLARSTRLALLEQYLENYISTTKQHSRALSEQCEITLKERQILQNMGKIFLIRNKLNLHNELIDTPDLYWSEPHLEKIYAEISRELDVLPRIAILNKKLDYVSDEATSLLAVLNEKKGTRLEWIIIWLILIEVFFETFHFYERYVLERRVKEAESKIGLNVK